MTTFTLEKLVPSETMRQYFQDIEFTFTDEQQATILWNEPGKNRWETLEPLRELANETSSLLLRQQILDRIAYEEKKVEVFRQNQEGKYVYVVEERNEETGNEYACGFFAECERAWKYAMRYAKEYEVACNIRKQLIVRSEEDEKVKNSWRGNPNLGLSTEEEYVDYSGAPVSEVGLDKEGNIEYCDSNELLKEEEDKVDEFRRERFEGQFIKLPFEMQIGSCVKAVYDGTYGILAEGEEDWNRYLQRIEERNLYVDYSDVQVMVFCLSGNGVWSHEHINPLYLEYAFPEYIPGDSKQCAYRAAMEALSDYIIAFDKVKKGERQIKPETMAQMEEQVYTTAMGYAKECREMEVTKERVLLELPKWQEE